MNLLTICYSTLYYSNIIQLTITVNNNYRFIHVRRIKPKYPIQLGSGSYMAVHNFEHFCFIMIWLTKIGD